MDVDEDMYWEQFEDIYDNSVEKEDMPEEKDDERLSFGVKDVSRVISELIENSDEETKLLVSESIIDVDIILSVELVWGRSLKLVE